MLLTPLGIALFAWLGCGGDGDGLPQCSQPPVSVADVCVCPGFPGRPFGACPGDNPSGGLFFVLQCGPNDQTVIGPDGTPACPARFESSNSLVLGIRLAELGGNVAFLPQKDRDGIDQVVFLETVGNLGVASPNVSVVSAIDHITNQPVSALSVEVSNNCQCGS